MRSHWLESAAFFVCAALSGCAASEPSAGGPQPSPRASAPQPAPAGDRPAALLNGRPITYDALRPALLESAGGLALRDAALDMLLDAELARRGQTITDDDVAAEGRYLAESMLREAEIGMADADRVLASLRRSRGLGEHRYAALLTRTAMLRRLVAGSVTVSDEEVAEAHRINHGPRSRVRLITTGLAADAAEIRARVLADPALARVRFIEAAANESTDPSAARGGLLAPISHADPEYPVAFREALAALAPGEVSSVLALDRGFALVLCEEVWPADGTTPEEDAPRARAAIRLRKERLAMEREAQRLLDAAELTILDRSLEWSHTALRASSPK
ncbi:MAG: peptidylprolyl isomerase [Phycisphaerae bacterium]|nr:peptidylprolyl isomerase [Phycisphaerae bacterium]